MLRIQRNGLSYYRFENLDKYRHLIQAIFSRHGGVSYPPLSSLNVGSSVGDDALAVAENHRLIFEALNVSPSDVVTAHQVHGTHIAVARKGDGGRRFPATDAIISNIPGLVLMLRFADCVPIMLYDPTHEAIGLVHAGWRGLARGIIRQTLLQMSEVYNSRAEDIIAGIGPSIGPCCYTVGPEVATQMKFACGGSDDFIQRSSDGPLYLDLWETSRYQLMDMGVHRIEVAAICTSCRVDEFFSYRAEGEHTGRFAALLGLQPKPGVGGS